MTKRYQPFSSGGVQGVGDLGAPAVGAVAEVGLVHLAWRPGRRSARSGRTGRRAERRCSPSASRQSWVAAGSPYGGPATVRHPSVFLPEAITELGEVGADRSREHPRPGGGAVLAGPRAADLVHHVLADAGHLHLLAVPVRRVGGGLAAQGVLDRVSGTSWQNSIRGSSISTVFRLAIGVGAGSGAAFSSSLQPVITPSARTAAETRTRTGRRADERSMRPTVGVLTYARPA